ncbi:SAM-dependent methyltransferase [Sphingomonas sp.]|uniref:SAM-dependent methyltransferase n=1 Tax=Sphingomonas sp. TaxID=28214 RepID=UPI003B3B01FC
MTVAMQPAATSPARTASLRFASPWRMPLAIAAEDRAVLHRIDHALIALRRAGRRAVRIVDPRCGSGTWLFRAARHAAWLGFVAIEARGVDADPARIAQARNLAAGVCDPRVGFDFEVDAVGCVLADGDEEGADIMLCHGGSAVADASALSGIAQIVVRMEGGDDLA